MNEIVKTIGGHIALTARLVRSHGVTIAIILLAGKVVALILTQLAVEIGMLNRFAGLMTMVPVILLQLVVFVAIFVVLRGPVGEDAAARAGEKPGNGHPDNGDSSFLAGAMLVVLVPFYGYYAGWGFLQETLRDYSKAFLDAQWNRVDFTDPEKIGVGPLEVAGSLWMLLPVVLVWLVRRMAKARQEASGRRIWPLLIVACEATWVIIGLYVLSNWQGEFVALLTKFPSPREALEWLLPKAQAAISPAGRIPVDWEQPVRPGDWLSSLFWFALLPLVWFNLGAIVFGHDPHSMSKATRRISGRALDRWTALPRPIRDFLGHFWVGLIRRWHAVVNGIMLAASAGLCLTVSILVLWRLADWTGRWAWLGLAELIGPQDHRIWNMAAIPLSILFGTPGQLQDGVVVAVVQFCVLAAGLRLATEAARTA